MQGLMECTFAHPPSETQCPREQARVGQGPVKQIGNIFNPLSAFCGGLFSCVLVCRIVYSNLPLALQLRGHRMTHTYPLVLLFIRGYYAFYVAILLVLYHNASYRKRTTPLAHKEDPDCYT